MSQKLIRVRSTKANLSTTHNSFHIMYKANLELQVLKQSETNVVLFVYSFKLKLSILFQKRSRILNV